MPVIINDFELISLPPSQEEQAAPSRPTRDQEPMPQPLHPDDVERILCRFVQRRLRLWAD